LLTGATLAGSRILFNPLNRLTQNLRIRQAIAMAIDPATVFAGSMGATPAMGLLPPESPQFNAGFRNANAYNPERSAALLTEAGYPDVINDLVLFSNERTDEVKTIRDNLQAAGIRTKQIAGDWQQMMDGMRSGEIAIVYVTERMDFNDAFAAVGTPCVATDAPAFQPCNEQVINLLAQAEKLPRASAERTALYQQMQDIIVNQEVSQFVLGWRKSIGLAREGEGAPLHLIFGMPNLEDAPATQP
jgi:ABC-type transport system substrate-binding protein